MAFFHTNILYQLPFFCMNILNYLKNTMPEIYAEVEKTGIEQFRKNIEMLIIYDKTKNYYLEQHSREINVPESEALEWYTNNISTNTEGFFKNKDMIISKLEDEKQNIIISSLIKQLKNEGEIKIYER